MAIHGDPRAAEAIASLADPAIAIEIIVVNTGHGSLQQTLGNALECVVLVESPRLCMPGGTRNLGVAEATAPVVAFLAADCLATTGWAFHRIVAHQRAEAVSSPILPAPSANGRVPLASLAVHMLMYCRRDPDYPAVKTARYGASYASALFTRHGRFAEDLMVGEDSQFNARLAVPPVWAPAVLTLHRNPITVGVALSDAYRRGALLYDWSVAATSHPIGRSLRRIAGAFAYAMSMLVRLPANRCGALLAAAPLAGILALAQAAGAISRIGGRPSATGD